MDKLDGLMVGLTIIGWMIPEVLTCISGGRVRFKCLANILFAVSTPLIAYYFLG